MATNSEFIKEIADHVAKCGGTYSQWYAGVAANARTRLFNDHNVNEKNDAWIFRNCANTDQARAVEDHFLNKGMKGGPGGGDDDTTYVYAYKITSTTKE